MVGDTIEVDSVTGEVTSIDLVSLKLRTVDNLMVRLPNEMLLASRLTNLTRFPIRRADLQIGISYSEDVPRVIAILHGVASRSPPCLEEPAPLVVHSGYGESSVDLQFSVWATQENWLEMRTQILLAIKQAFDAEGVEFASPQMAVHMEGGRTGVGGDPGKGEG